jgi:BMFP domain-containing protein YqiC
MPKYIVFVCFATFLLVVPAVATPQTNVETNASGVQGTPQPGGSEATQPVAAQGHLVKPAWLQSWIDRYSRAANNVGKYQRVRPVYREQYPRVRPVYQLAQSSGALAKPEETISRPVSESKTEPKSVTPEEVAALKARIAELEAKSDSKTDSKPEAAPKPASEEEVEALRTRIAELEKQLGAVVASASSAAPKQQEQAPNGTPQVDLVTPFADHDWTWLNGISRQHDYPLDTKYFSGEFRADTFYGYDFNQPRDHSMGGSSEVFRSGEVQLEDLSFGGDFHAGNMRGRVLFLFGMFATTTPRNDASAGVGQWDVRSAYKYVSEAYGGYHFNFQHGVNVDAGIFVSYVGLFSYHNYDNWAYQPSYVSSNTPWFFNGVRIQWFPTNHLKIEPWFINGWQSYNKFNGHPGVGGQLKWTPLPWMNIVANQYAVGNDNIGLPNRGRYHTDDSIEIKYYDHPKAGNGINRMAFTFTGDVGCETGDGVTCHGGKGPYDPATGKGGPAQSFIGYMLYNRWWWHKDAFAFTLGGGQINNKGRYLTLVLPVNGADAVSGTPYFPSYPGAPFHAYDGTATFDWMPNQYTTFRWEFGYRHATEAYWSGRGGITPPNGNNGAPGFFVCSNGTSSGATDIPSAQAACGGGPNSVWSPDLRRGQAMISMSVMVKL